MAKTGSRKSGCAVAWAKALRTSVALAPAPRRSAETLARSWIREPTPDRHLRTSAGQQGVVSAEDWRAYGPIMNDGQALTPA